jgi:hypothetical protein
MRELAASDVNEYVVAAIIDHRYKYNVKKKSNLEFLVQWEGYDESYDTWEPYQVMKEVAILDQYAKDHPELKLG